MKTLRNRKANRLLHYDYSTDNLYFITTCVHDRDPVFGRVVNGEIELNAFGQIARDQLMWLENQYNYVKIHEWIVMPDHVHALIEINRRLLDTVYDVGTGRDLSLHRDLSLCDPEPSSKIKSLSELMGVYKTTTSKHIRLLGLTSFAWQRSFHDHIVRDERSYWNIRKYIQNNPANWQR